MSLRAPLNQVLGLGTAKDGTGHFWRQRISGIALVLLGLWFVASVVSLGALQYDAVIDFISRPLNSVLMLLTCLAVAYHSNLGVQVVIEDYVHANGLKLAALILSRFAHVFVAALSVYAILLIGLGA
ncbi:MAG: succinate dehydrogenase, hydrophobic membrane anchor protein [Woeseiaceae bacterium]|nr:succinate dehydrogenase, hydrophobic membrane anchor protein [Woeseiaceae bacterium]NIP19684.1 succinate dehydrogenase, hydrophobic membrane anchor protein [Woeseiaceae bacterium]NIS89801.1 succinate dehydrogenase, hydrophobic membrane anchor protein [Woeseiaceae bacterium]